MTIKVPKTISYMRSARGLDRVITVTTGPQLILWISWTINSTQELLFASFIWTEVYGEFPRSPSKQYSSSIRWKEGASQEIEVLKGKVRENGDALSLLSPSCIPWPQQGSSALLSHWDAHSLPDPSSTYFTLTLEFLACAPNTSDFCFNLSTNSSTPLPPKNVA